MSAVERVFNTLVYANCPVSFWSIPFTNNSYSILFFRIVIHYSLEPASYESCQSAFWILIFYPFRIQWLKMHRIPDPDPATLVD